MARALTDTHPGGRGRTVAVAREQYHKTYPITCVVADTEPDVTMSVECDESDSSAGDSQGGVEKLESEDEDSEASELPPVPANPIIAYSGGTNTTKPPTAQVVQYSTWKIGKGVYGEVEMRLFNSRHCAVKFARRAQLHNLHKLRNEYSIIMQLEHPNIIKPYGWTVNENNQRGLLMPYYPGGSLRECIDRNPMFIWGVQFDAVITGVLRAMVYLNSRGVAHMDLHCGNVLLGPYMNPLLIDFGQAVTKDCGELPLRGPRHGTAPEICLNWNQYDARYSLSFSTKVDIYSFGMMVYRCFMGVCPYQRFKEWSEFDWAKKSNVSHLTLQDFQFSKRIWESIMARGVPIKYQRLIESATRLDPEQRPNAEQLLANFLLTT